MKTITKIPFRKTIQDNVEKINTYVKYTNFWWFITVFIYVNIALYFALWIKIIFSL